MQGGYSRNDTHATNQEVSMNRSLAGIIALGLLCAPMAWADKGLESTDPLTPFAFETITVSSTAIGFTAATYNPTTGKAKRVFLSCATNPIRFRYDGTNPTTTVGHVLSAGSSINITGGNAIDNFKMIASGSDATCSATYER
jgi:hypothetical protein